MAAGWTLPGGNLANTRDVASAITSSNVSTLGVAWCVPVESTGAARAAGVPDGYATTPVVVNGVTSNVVFTTTYDGHLYAFNAATGAILLNTPLSAGTNAPVTIDGDYVITGAANVQASGQRPLIIAYKLGAKGKLPDTVR